MDGAQVVYLAEGVKEVLLLYAMRGKSKDGQHRNGWKHAVLLD
jgi:hypothetical protein